ncbi:MAG: hypothetical protein JSR33_05440 [Proteobacteria bacterium]|nr:hypothetical protein [Pseudomonadota bacterium]
MLKRINAYGVESDTGSSIQRSYREYLTYKSREKVFELSVGDDLKKKTYIYPPASAMFYKMSEAEKME